MPLSLKLKRQRQGSVWTVLWAVSGAGFLVGAVALVRDTVHQGQDFEVFWRAGLAIRTGQPLYDLVRDGAMVFKYPPWIAAFFIPLSFFSEETAKWCWGITNVVSLLLVLRWVLARTPSGGWVAVSVVSFWGIWAVHALDGQISLPMLAILLNAFDAHDRWRMVPAFFATSAKVFSGLAVLGFGKRLMDWRSWIFAAVIAAVMSIPAVLAEPGRSVLSLLDSWKSAATSGQQSFGGKVISRDNQGLPALISRHFSEVSEITSAVVIALLLGVAWAWIARRRRLDPATFLIGWASISVCAHPLAWFHSFVFSFPACAIALDRAMRGRSLGPKLSAVAALFATAIITRSSFGSIGAALELWSIKSWGSLLALATLAWLGPDPRALRSGVRA